MKNQLKAKIRQELIEKLCSMSADERSLKSSALSQNLLLLLESLCSETSLLTKKLAGFAPMRTEPLWFKSFVGKHEMQLYLPTILNETQMEFRKNDWSDLKQEKVNWKSHSANRSESDFDVVLVPGLAFTKEGKRLGRGKGYYDRFLEKDRGIKIGIAFEEQILTDLPVTKEDIMMDFIVTNQRYIKCKGEK